jgi:hypothetical protein
MIVRLLWRCREVTDALRKFGHAEGLTGRPNPGQPLGSGTDARRGFPRDRPTPLRRLAHPAQSG